MFEAIQILHEYFTVGQDLALPVYNPNAYFAVILAVASYVDMILRKDVTFSFSLCDLLRKKPFQLHGCENPELLVVGPLSMITTDSGIVQVKNSCPLHFGSVICARLVAA